MGHSFKDVPFAMQEGAAGIPQNSAETLINMYCELSTSGRSKLVRKQRACLASVYSLPGEKRCIERFRGTHYLIVGSTFYSYDGVTLTTLGTLSSSSGRCTMICNENGQIMISDRVRLYYWNGSAVALVSNPAGFTPGVLSYLNGYGIVNSVGEGKFYATAANDFSTIDALDFATAESNIDRLMTTFVDHNEIVLAGTDSIEIWSDVGGTDFPFQAITSAKIERGTVAPLSFAADDNTWCFVGNDLVVYRVEAYRPVRVSTFAIEEWLRKAPNIAEAAAFVYTMGGHKFYTLTIPGYGTRQYNFATNLWNAANSYGYPEWRVVGSAGHNTDYVLTDAGIARLSADVNQDEGGTVVRKAISAPGWAGGNRIIMNGFFLDVEVGGTASASADPQVMLRVARDAETFGNYRQRSLGTQGNYIQRVVWRSLGWGRKPVLEVSCSDDVRFAILGTEMLADVAES